MGTLLLADKRPQLLENDLSPFWGLALVPSGNIIIDVPSLSFIDPSFMTFLRLVSFLARFKCIGFKHANAHPKKGIYNSSLLMMLDDGIHIVCKKNDSHAPWWFETKINGPSGIFLIPETSQDILQINFNEASIKFIQYDAIDCKKIVFTKGNNKIIAKEAGMTVMYKIKLNKRLLNVCNF